VSETRPPIEPAAANQPCRLDKRANIQGKTKNRPQNREGGGRGLRDTRNERGMSSTNGRVRVGVVPSQTRGRRGRHLATANYAQNNEAAIFRSGGEIVGRQDTEGESKERGKRDSREERRQPTLKKIAVQTLRLKKGGI